MIDLKALRENPEKFKDGCRKKGFAVDIDHVLKLDAQRRALQTERERLRAEQGKLEKESGPQIGKLKGALKKAAPGVTTPPAANGVWFSSLNPGSSTERLAFA